ELNLSYFSGVDYIPAENILEMNESDNIDFNQVKLEILHTPGHTRGSISVLMNEILFSGDLLFNEGVGRTDLPTGNWDDLEKSLKEKIYTLPGHFKVFPGHGPETIIEHEKNNNPFVKGSR
ncbi:MAG: MBL fold metallo-hydrolase, partial [bacterium]|nr:MBL fold metallo-hydrolase [bacterium]